MVADRLKSFGTTVFSEMTKLAQEYGAINLAQGFPDFDGPDLLKDAAFAAMKRGDNQYARSMGHPLLCRAIAEQRRRDYGLEYDPDSEVVVFSGASEGIAAAMFGLLNPGDEVLLLEPFYDSYPANVILAGAVPRYVTLHFPDFKIDFAELERLVTSRTRLLLLNSPHNPSGKVFSRVELEELARFVQKHNLIVITDEVYEKLTYDGVVHIPFAALPGMARRTVSLSSAGKTFSMTGWKIGWGTGPRDLMAACQASHQFLTFAVATPFQIAVAEALNSLDQGFYDQVRQEYSERRNFLMNVLIAAGFEVRPPDGTYFVLADFSRVSNLDDRAFARTLTRDYGVAAIPPSVFYSRDPSAGRCLVRFAFCKRMSTLEAAAERLRRLKQC